MYNNIKLDAKYAVPQQQEQRQNIYDNIQKFCIDTNTPVPPLTLPQLTTLAKQCHKTLNLPLAYIPYITVLLQNQLWQDTIAQIPFHRRILLLPQCLRKKEKCPAQTDAFGILCQSCGKCPTGAIQDLAEELGYVVLIAEGSTVVGKLLEQGKIDAVIGVSCLDALKRSFENITKEAIPSLALPLHSDGCDATQVDLIQLKKLLHLQAPQKNYQRLDFQQMRTTINNWLTKNNLKKLLNLQETYTEQLTVQWLCNHGKRWRPLLTLASYLALGGKDQELIMPLALAVECFHKASLIHDDIEDNDIKRYNQPTIHATAGIPIAINTGDFILGCGYKLLTKTTFPDTITSQLLQVASQGHLALARGQGEELCWQNNPQLITQEQMINIFKGKTSPAFSIALQLGAIAAGATPKIMQTLQQFSNNLGIAYQINDDLQDLSTTYNPAKSLQPSIITALACDHASQIEKQQLIDACKQNNQKQLFQIRNTIINKYSLVEHTQKLSQHYKEKTFDSLYHLTNITLKTLLFRLTNRLLNK